MVNKIFIALLLLFSTILIKAQAPEKINYQAVARDLSGNPLVNQSLNVTYEIRQGSPTGISVYTETHTGITTNQFGLFTAEIGGGIPSAGTFAGINWGTSLYYLSVFVNGDLMGSTQLLSVPYALYSKQSANGPQGLPGKNNLTNISAEPAGANCQFGGTKVDVGLDDNANNILETLEIDDTYFVCNADTTPSGQGFWSIDANNNIYNNNSSGGGNVGIGTTAAIPKQHKLTVFSTDTVIASFVGNNPGGAVILIADTNQTAPTGIVFANNADTSALLALDPATKFLTLFNGIQNGDLLIATDRNLILKSHLILNDADTFVITKGNTGNVYTNNRGLFDTDSLRVRGFGANINNYVLTNNGNGNAIWKDPNTLISGGSSPWNRNAVSGSIFPATSTDNVGIGTTTPSAKLDVFYNGNNDKGININYISNSNVGVNTGIISLAQNTTSGPVHGGYFQVMNSSLSNFSTAVKAFNTANSSSNTGLESSATGTGNTNIGVFSFASGASTNFAGYFGSGNIGDGRVYIQDELGIGTTTPTAKLHLDGTLRLNNLGGPVPAVGNVLTTIDAQGNAQWQPLPSTTGFWSLNGTNDIYNNNTGNVGVGTTTPMVNLHIARDSNSVLLNHVAANTPNVESGIITARSRGTLLAPSAIQSGDEIGTIGFMGYDGTGFTNLSTGMTAIATQTFSAAAQGMSLSFLTTPNGSNLNQTRMTINHDGNVGIGTTTPSAQLDVDNGGSIEVDGEYIYETPKTRYLTIGEADFRLARSANADIYSSFGSGGVGIINSSNSTNALVAPVYLPDSATVTNVEVYYVDNSTSSMIIDFQKRALNGGLSNITSVTTSSLNSSLVQISAAPTTTVIDNQNNSYNIRVFSNGWTSGATPDMKIYTVRITYTVSKSD